jgi:hypothetical protein
MDISQPETNNVWTTVPYKISRPAQEEYQREQSLVPFNFHI